MIYEYLWIFEVTKIDVKDIYSTPHEICIDLTNI